MKLGFILGVAAVLALAGASFAGDYHAGATLICADCHVMHGSQSHGYAADGSGSYLPVGAGGPFVYLLRDEETKLCLACHDGQAWAPDVLEANTGAAINRMAGALNKTTSSGTYNPAGGHTLGSMATAPGGTFADAEGLKCTDCHHQHGKDNSYRNLQNLGGAVVTAAVTTNDPAKDVFERSPASYDISQVDFNEPATTASKMGAWCQGCHTDYHGNASSPNMRDQAHAAGEGWLRHPTAEANIGAIGGGHSALSQFRNNLYRTKVMSASGDWGTQGVAWAAAPADLTPSCFSCHKGHGNQNAFGLIYMTGTAAPTEEGNAGGTAKTLCKQCHRQG
jgi:hypothetical protein